MFGKRRSIRLKNYDYNQQGAYFVTICIQNRECLLGKIVGVGPRAYPFHTQSRAYPKMKLSPAGEMVLNLWEEIPQYYSEIRIDEFIIMPNHIHGIIFIQGIRPAKRGQAQGLAPTNPSKLSDIICRFKSLSTHQYSNKVKYSNWKPFHKKLWQRNYYEHIIRNDKSLNRIREYIQNNPFNWNTDQYNYLAMT